MLYDNSLVILYKLYSSWVGNRGMINSQFQPHINLLYNYKENGMGEINIFELTKLK